MLDVRLVRLTLRAAIAHAKQRGGSDPRSTTIFFVRCVRDDMKKRRWYDSAYTISRVLTALEQSPTVKDALAVFGLAVSDVVAKPSPSEPPASNTGVTPRPNNQDKAIQELLNGKAD